MTLWTRKIRFAKSILASLGGAGWLGLFTTAVVAQPAMTPVRLPLYFEANRGQVDSPAQFIARGLDSQFLISPGVAQLVLFKMTGPQAFSARAVRMQFVGGNGSAQISGTEELSGKINYLMGNESARWQTGVETFAKVQVADVYSGVNLTYYGNQRQLEYDFAIAPGANPGVIAIRFDGANNISVNPAGELVLNLGGSEILQPKPVIYQIANGARREISGGYKILDAQTVGFAIGDYDRSLPLVIDPILSYSTYFGGNADDTAWKVAVGTNGFVYVAGQTLSSQFAANKPLSTSGAFQTNYQGGAQVGDAFVAKFSNNGSNLVYFTYLGGSADDAAYGLAVDAAGDAYVAGATVSPNFPTKNAIYTNISGVAIPQVGYPADAFVAELDPSGSNLVYSTYLGGANSDAAYGIAVDLSGNAYLTGFSYSTNFPVTNAIQNHLACRPNTLYVNNNANAFVAKIGAGGSPLIFSTYFGGTNYDLGRSIAVDGAGNIYIAGFTDSTNFPTTNALQTVLGGSTNIVVVNNAFVAKFAPSGTNLIYSTFLGGTNGDQAFGIAADTAGNAYVTGGTTSPNFPNTATNVPGLFNKLTNNLNGLIFTTNSFLAKLGPQGTNLVYSAVFGGSSIGVASGVAVDPLGNAFVCGTTTSTNFPTLGATGLLAATNSGGSDVFVTAFNTNGTALLYSVELGGAKNDFGYGIALDSSDNAYVVGQTLSSNFPTNNALHSSLNGPSDAFLAKIISTVIPPQITTQPTNQTIGVGSTVSFVVSATGTAPLRYRWQMEGTNLVWTNLVNGGSISGVTNTTLTITNLQVTNSGNYQVIVTNYGGAVTSSVAVLTVTNVATVLTLQPASQTVGVGSTVTFDVGGTAQAPFYLHWLKDGTNLVDGTNSSGSIINGSTNDPLTIINARTNDSGTYWLVISNAWGVLASSNAVLTVLTSPSFANITTGGGSTGAFILSGVGGTNSGTYFVLASSNLSTPFSLWAPVATNQFGSQGQFIFTNIVPTNMPQRFYILKMQ